MLLVRPLLRSYIQGYLSQRRVGRDAIMSFYDHLIRPLYPLPLSSTSCASFSHRSSSSHPCSPCSHHRPPCSHHRSHRSPYPHRTRLRTIPNLVQHSPSLANPEATRASRRHSCTTASKYGTLSTSTSSYVISRSCSSGIFSIKCARSLRCTSGLLVMNLRYQARVTALVSVPATRYSRISSIWLSIHLILAADGRGKQGRD